MNKWEKVNISEILKILIKARSGLGLSEAETREEKLTRVFNKLHTMGYIGGTFYRGAALLKDGCVITVKGLYYLTRLEEEIEGSI